MFIKPALKKLIKGMLQTKEEEREPKSGILKKNKLHAYALVQHTQIDRHNTAAYK
jgi:hypothetical protein